MQQEYRKFFSSLYEALNCNNWLAICSNTTCHVSATLGEKVVTCALQNKERDWWKMSDELVKVGVELLSSPRKWMRTTHLAVLWQGLENLCTRCTSCLILLERILRSQSWHTSPYVSDKLSDHCCGHWVSLPSALVVHQKATAQCQPSTRGWAPEWRYITEGQYAFSLNFGTLQLDLVSYLIKDSGPYPGFVLRSSCYNTNLVYVHTWC
jgi:hypothetical protein